MSNESARVHPGGFLASDDTRSCKSCTSPGGIISVGRRIPIVIGSFKACGGSEQFLAAGDPVISVDTKKKELIGEFQNAGSTDRRTAYEVNAHDFPTTPYARRFPTACTT